MEGFGETGTKFNSDGFAVLDNVFSFQETEMILSLIEAASSDRPAFRKANELFAIRQILKEIPELRRLIFTDKLYKMINGFFGDHYFVVKSIYFDKPPASNWFVPYHQDLTISIAQKAEVDGFHKWTVRQDQYAVQPPVALLQNNFTIRIHLDDTDKNNGALKVIAGSHLKGVIRPEITDLAENQICEVKKGGIMLMRPLLLHASNKITNANRRRVIHVEFSNCILPEPLQWAELRI